MRQSLPPPPVQSHLPPPVSTAGGERRVRDRWRRRRAAGLADAGMLALGGAAAVLAAPASAVSRDGMWWALAYLLGTLVILELRGFYDFRLHRSPVDDLERIFVATAISAMVLIALPDIDAGRAGSSRSGVEPAGSSLTAAASRSSDPSVDRRSPFACRSRSPSSSRGRILLGVGPPRSIARPAPSRRQTVQYGRVSNRVVGTFRGADAPSPFGGRPAIDSR